MSAQKVFNPGKSDKRMANRYMDQQGGIANDQMQQYQQAMPQLQQIQQLFQQMAGMGPQGMSGPGASVAPARYNDVYAQRRGINVPQQQPGMDPNMGIWNNPTDRFRMGQAQDDIDRYQMQQQNQLRHNLGGRGIMDSSVTGGAMQRLASDAMREQAGARRDLAISAPQEQERRAMMFMQSLAPMLGMGQQAFENYGGLAGQKMQQANQANSVLPNMLGTAANLYGMGAFGGAPKARKF